MNIKTVKRVIVILLTFIVAFFAVTTVSATDPTETEIIPFDTDKVSVNAMNLVLSGDIGLVYHVYVHKDCRDGYAVLDCRGDDEVTQVNISECPKDTNGRYMVTYTLSAIQLSEPVTITVYDSNGVAMASKSKSASEYVDLMIADAKATAEEKAVGVALINYGHYAQLACAEYSGWTLGTDYKATAEYSAPTVLDSVFDDYGLVLTGSESDALRFRLSLDLDYRTGIYLYIYDDQCPVISLNGVSTALTDCGNGCFRLEIKGINAMNIADTYEVKTEDGVTLEFSALSYCKLAVSRNNCSINTKNAVRALYEFYMAIENYNDP